MEKAPALEHDRREQMLELLGLPPQMLGEASDVGFRSLGLLHQQRKEHQNQHVYGHVEHA